MSCTNMASLFCLGGATWEAEDQLFSSFSTHCQFRLQSNDVEMVAIGNELEYDQTVLSCCVLRKVLVIPFYQPNCLIGTPKPPAMIDEKSGVKTDSESKRDKMFSSLSFLERGVDPEIISRLKYDECGGKTPHIHEYGEVTFLKHSKNNQKTDNLVGDGSEMNIHGREEKSETESELDDLEKDTSEMIKCFRRRPVLKERDLNENKRNHPYDKEFNNIIDYDSGYEIEIVVENVDKASSEQLLSSQCVDFFSDLKRRRRDLKKRNEAMMSNKFDYKNFRDSGDDNGSSNGINCRNKKSDSLQYGFDDSTEDETSSTGGDSVKGLRGVKRTRTRKKRKSTCLDYQERRRRSRRCAGKAQR